MFVTYLCAPFTVTVPPTWSIPPPPHFDSRQCETQMKALKSKERPNGFEKEDFSTEKNEAIFWQSAVRGPRNELLQCNMRAAWDWAAKQTPPRKTVEKTAGGLDLEDMKLFEAQNQYTCPGRACTGADLAKAGYYWNCASMWFAQQASGEIHAFGSNAKLKTDYGGNGIPTFWNIELPNLLENNPNVKIIYHYNENDYVWYRGARKKYTDLSTDEINKLPVRGNLIYKKYYVEGQRYPSYSEGGKEDDFRIH